MRITPHVIAALMLAAAACANAQSYPEKPIKFVVSSESDLAEIDTLLRDLKNWSPSDVQLMPEGTNTETLARRAPWIADICKARGFRYCPRLHIELFGNQRRT